MKERGITLIALVITVIVLLILAGAAVSIGLNRDNLFAKANEAKDEWNAKVIEEDNTLSNYWKYLEEKWTIVWTYDATNDEWSNPCFYDEELEKTLDIEYDYEWEGHQISYRLDEDYSINSKENINGDMVAKLYPDGTLIISGEGNVSFMVDPGTNYEASPFRGYCHITEYSSDEDEEVKYGEFNSSLSDFLSNHIKKVTFEEGITGIGHQAFAFMQELETVEFSSTIMQIDEQAFLETGWLANLYATVPGYYTETTESFVVDVEINGITFNLHAYENW